TAGLMWKSAITSRRAHRGMDSAPRGSGVRAGTALFGPRLGHAVPIVGDRRVAMGNRAAVLVDPDEDDPVDAEDGLARDHIAHHRLHRQRSAPEMSGDEPHLDEVAFPCRGPEVDLR